MTTQNTTTAVPKSRSWQMFNSISPRYDFINHLLSFGLDGYWRRKLVRSLPERHGQKILDLCTGTAEVLLSLFKENPYIHSAYGVDLSEDMMAIGRRKIARRNLNHYITLRHGDVNQLAFENNSFNGVTMAFGIRNTEDPNRVLREMYRVLKKEGRAVVMEFSIPANIIIRMVFQFYISFVIPLIGKIFTKHGYAYEYLNKTIHDFPYGSQFCNMMTNTGFNNVAAKPLIFGAVTIYTGDKI